jgi:hypothetical protein
VKTEKAANSKGKKKEIIMGGGGEVGGEREEIIDGKWEFALRSSPQTTKAASKSAGNKGMAIRKIQKKLRQLN